MPERLDDQLFAAGDLHLDVEVGAITERLQHILQTSAAWAPLREQSLSNDDAATLRPRSQAL